MMTHSLGSFQTFIDLHITTLSYLFHALFEFPTRRIFFFTLLPIQFPIGTTDLKFLNFGCIRRFTQRSIKLLYPKKLQNLNTEPRIVLEELSKLGYS